MVVRFLAETNWVKKQQQKNKNKTKQKKNKKKNKKNKKKKKKQQHQTPPPPQKKKPQQQQLHNFTKSGTVKQKLALFPSTPLFLWYNLQTLINWVIGPIRQKAVAEAKYLFKCCTWRDWSSYSSLHPGVFTWKFPRRPLDRSNKKPTLQPCSDFTKTVVINASNHCCF